MKNIYCSLAALALTAAVSCQKEIAPADLESGKPDEADGRVEMTFGVIGEDDTRTFIDGLDIKWDKDAISIIDDSLRIVGTTARTGNNKFTTTGSGTTTATFTGTAKEDAGMYYAVSPYCPTAIVSANEKISGFESAPAKGLAFPILNDRDGGLNIFIPSLQKPLKGSFDPNAHYLVGKTAKPDSLRMFNVGALVKFTLSTGSIKEVIFRGIANEIIAGFSLVKIAEDGTPTTEPTSFVSESFRYIKLQPASGTAFEPGDYYICTSPATLASGICLELSDTLGRVAEKTSANSLELKRAGLVKLGVVDNGLKWCEKQEVLFLDFVNQSPSYSSPFNAEPYKSFRFSQTPYFAAEHQFFSNYKNSEFSQTADTAKVKWKGKTITAKMFTGDSLSIYIGSYISPNPSQGLRLSSCSVNVPGREGKYVHKVELYCAVSSSSDITVLSQDSTAVEGGGSQAQSTGGCISWYPKAGIGNGVKICGSLMTSMMRIYYSESDDPAPAFADAAFTRFVADQCTDAGTTATLRGAFTMKSASFSSDAVEYGFEYRLGSGEWTSVSASEYAKSTVNKIVYYCYKADISGLTATKTHTWRAWVKGSGDSSRKYGGVKYIYPSKNNLVVDFPDNPQVTKLAGHNSLLSSLTTSSKMSAATQNYTLDFYSGFEFSLFDQHGVAKTTGGSGSYVSNLLFSPYHKDCDFTDSKGGNGWIKLPAREGRKLEKVTVSLSGSSFKFNANLSAAVDADGLGDASIAADESLTGSSKIELTASGTAANTSYYLCFSPDADGTGTKTNSLGITKLEIKYATVSE